MTAVLKAILDALIGLVTSNLGGVQGWIVKMLLKYGGQAAIEAWDNFMAYIKREKVQKKAEEKKDEVVQNPDSTTEEIGKAYEDMFNAGREKK